MKDQKAIAIVNAFQKILHEPNRKPSKIWEDKGSTFCNRSINHGKKKNAVEMNSTHNEGKSVVAERFIRTVINKIYKFMTSVSKMSIL